MQRKISLDSQTELIIKLFNIDDTTWQDDMNAVEVLIKAVQKDEENEHVDTTTNNVRIRRRGVGGYDNRSVRKESNITLQPRLPAPNLLKLAKNAAFPITA